MGDINFGMDGFVLDGTRWYNAKTGDTFVVKSNYFENNQMILQATDGRTFDLNRIQNDYVQWTGQGEPPKPQKAKSKPASTQLPPEVLNEIDDSNPDSFLDPEDAAMINGLGNINKPTRERRIDLTPQPTVTPNHSIIDKALSKTKMPVCDLAMKWTKFPAREIEMLTDIMDIPLEEIADYYMSHILRDMNEFEAGLKLQLQDYIMSKMSKSTPTTTRKPQSGRKQTKKDGKE